MRTELYVSGYNLKDYLGYLRRDYSDLFSILSPERCSEADRLVAEMNADSWEFENEQLGGRGLAYNSAQKSLDSRKVGMTALLKALSPSGRDSRILDVLGGDGTFARFCKTASYDSPLVYTADISKFMIDACHAHGLPCVRQPATRSLFRDNVLDGILIAYGSHHLDANARHLATREAYRTLRENGRLVLHDFETGAGCARWFSNVVHPYSRTGHPYAHFSRQEMFDLLIEAGFRDVRVFEISDPFTLYGCSQEEAKRNAIMHMYNMYDLVKLANSLGDTVTRLERHITDTLGPISVQPYEGRYVAQIERHALVAIGVKLNCGS